MTGNDVDVTFARGDDFGLFMETKEADALSWRVVVRRPGCDDEPAVLVTPGDWLHPYRPVRPGEVIWDVGLSIMGAPGTEIVIERPGHSLPAVLAHPSARFNPPRAGVPMYQIEVKEVLVRQRFPRADGWSVTVDLDAMERAHGGRHPTDKADRARFAELSLRLHATIGAHPRYGRADIVATHPELGCWVVEVEGRSSRQRDQAMYSAIGQLVVSMREFRDDLNYALAVPDEEKWLRQVSRLPEACVGRLGLVVLAVSRDGVRRIESFVDGAA